MKFSTVRVKLFAAWEKQFILGKNKGKLMSQDLEERLVRLETLISMQDQMIEELNQVIITQQNELDKIKYEFQTISESMMNGGGDSSYANQKPPHYW